MSWFPYPYLAASATTAHTGPLRQLAGVRRGLSLKRTPDKANLNQPDRLPGPSDSGRRGEPVARSRGASPRSGPPVGAQDRAATVPPHSRGPSAPWPWPATGHQDTAWDWYVDGTRIQRGVMRTSRPLRLAAAAYRREKGLIEAQPR